MLNCMKRQLPECHVWRKKNFSFGTILCFFFFKRVPSLNPWETLRGHMVSHPSVYRCATLFPRQGGGRTIEAFDDNFFDWWSRLILTIEDYPYAKINFSRDLDMPIPPGVEWGEIGMFFFQSYLFFNSFYIYLFYVYQSIWKLCICYLNMWGPCT